MKSKTLCLYTSQFPYGVAGESFLEAEILHLAAAFTKVYLFPLRDNTTGVQREVPHNVEIIEWKSSGKIRKVDYGLALLLFLKYERSSVSYGLAELKRRLGRIRRACIYANGLSTIIKTNGLDSDSVIHYSYWFGQWATVLSVMKTRGLISGFVSRIHGFDLFNDRHSRNIPYQEFKLGKALKVYSASNAGRKYLAKHYPDFEDKVAYDYLGVNNEFPLPEKSEHHKFTIVSCSRLVKVKRIELIVGALSTIETPVRWIHIGDGEERAAIERSCAELPPNTEVNLLGMLPNREVLSFYSRNYIDLFINVSLSEGVPVSIMEAASFGIPVIATDVGGNNEVVSDKNGKIIPAEAGPQKIAAEIISFMQAPPSQIKIFRKSIRALWREKFNAATNYPKFIAKLTSLHTESPR